MPNFIFSHPIIFITYWAKVSILNLLTTYFTNFYYTFITFTVKLKKNKNAWHAIEIGPTKLILRR